MPLRDSVWRRCCASKVLVFGRLNGRPSTTAILASYIRQMVAQFYRRRSSQILLIGMCVVLGLLVPRVSADDESNFSVEGIEFFEKRIRPVLVDQCYSCHSVKAADENKLKGGLFVDSRKGLIDGGDSGPAAAPSEPDGSLILEALRYESFEMPPKGQLAESVIEDFETWIEMGMPDPRQRAAAAPDGIDWDAGRRHWAYQTLVESTIPTGPAASPIDAWIQHRLREEGLRQVQLANRQTLVRRLYFDLAGLPPAPDEIDAFVRDDSPGAYVRLVDRLLASPRFGERWGRHWLDVARYADSITLRGFLLPEAWRYRDYVINTLNADRSLTDFIQEQVAGDLMPWTSLDERRRNLSATTFLTLGNSNLEDQDKQKLEMDVIDEQLEAICRGFLAQTIGCARCHDHKFDPIPTHDYYALASILRNTKTLNHANVSTWIELPLPVAEDKQAALQAYDQSVAALQAKITDVQQSLKSTGAEFANSVSVQTPVAAVDTRVDPRRRRELEELERELKRLQDQAPVRSRVMSVQEESDIAEGVIYVRGDVHNPGEAVERGFLQVVANDDALGLPKEQSGRLQLGQWLSSARNPLPSRVMANRVWHWLFGVGLVRTTDNFGSMGETPSHAQLLDYLASRLVQHDGSIKMLVREIVLSKTYRLDSDFDPIRARRELATDPENRLLWRMNRRRMDAECLLDTMLATSGELDLEMGGPTLNKSVKTDYGYNHRGTTRRAVYWPVLRNSMVPLCDVFDAANPSMVTGRRNVSTTARQSLFMMNNPQVIHWAMLGGARLVQESGLTDADRIIQAFRTTLGRQPTVIELDYVREFVAKDRGASDPSRDPAQAEADVWGKVIHVLFGSLDFRYVK